jgi:glutathione S-transferase
MSAPYTLIGTPYSTFTRTIALGLQYKGLKYDQKSTTPHSDFASRHHPFGFLPTLVIHEVDGKIVDDILLCESHAIVRFIDRIAPEPSLHVAAGTGGAAIEEKMWEMISLIAFLGELIIRFTFSNLRTKSSQDFRL